MARPTFDPFACGPSVSDLIMTSRTLPPPLMAAAIAQLLDEQRAALAELQGESYGGSPMQELLLQERIDWLEEELATRLPPGPG